MPVANPASELLEKADILEFPSIDDTNTAGNFIRSLRKDPSQLGALYMRAKAVYLLERYVEEQAITSMVVCLEPSNTKVGELAGLVASWVEKSHGLDPAAREQQTNGLFICFTKLDKEFAEPARRPKERRTDWSKRITATLIEEFGRHHTWPSAWTTSRAFDNVHILRNPNFRAKHLLNYANDGRELAFKAEQKDRVQRLRQDFVASDAVRRHVTDPASIWAEALELNDGGTAFLAQSIAEVCDARAKQRHVLNDLSLLGRSLRDRLQRYYVSDDLALQRDRRQIAALMVTRRLRRCAEERRLGHLIRALQLTDSEFNDVLRRHDAGSPGPNGAAAPGVPAAAPIMVRATATSNAVATHVNGTKVNGVLVNGAAVNGHGHANGHGNGHGHALTGTARTYAAVLMTHWVASARLFAQADRICQTLQIPRSGLLQLVDELIAGAARHDLEGRIATQIEQIMADAPEGEHQITRASMCAANIIGDFVMWLGCNDVLSNNHPRRKGRSQTPIFPPKPAGDIWSGPCEEPDFDREFLADWSQAFKTLVAENADGLDERSISAERNRLLGTLLQQLSITL